MMRTNTINTKQPHQKKIVVKEKKNINTIFNPIQIIMLFFFISHFQPLDAQNSSSPITEKQSKKKLKPYPFGLDKVWSKDLMVTAMSPDGNWIAYSEFFSIGENILRLRQVDKESNLILPAGYENKFSKNNIWFGSLSMSNKFILINLETGHKEDLESIQGFDFSYNGRFLSILKKGAAGRSILNIIDLENHTDRIITDITKFAWNPTSQFMLLVKGDEAKNVLLYDAVKRSETEIGNKSSGTVNFLKWNDTGSAAVIMDEANEKHRIGIYFLNKAFIPLEDSLLEQKLPNYELGNREPFLSNDGNTVLFFRKKKGKELGKEDKIEVWKTSDPLLYPSLKLREDFIYSYLLTGWYPKKEVIQEIATPQFPTAEMDIAHNFALVYNDLQYGAQNTEFLKADIYCKNIQTGETRLIVAEQLLTDLVSISPSGNYIAYFKNEDWWTYNVKENKAVNITKGLGTNFQNRDNEYPKDRIEVYDKPSWLHNDSKIIVSDKYDLWAINTNGKDAKRITKGRENGCRYMIKRVNDVDDFYHLTVGSFAGRKVDLDKFPLLQLINYDTHSTGISLLNKDLSTTSLNFGDKSIYQIYQSLDGNNVIYSTESTTLPKALHHYKLNTGKNNLIYQSNSDLLEYDLGYKTFINYTAKNKKLAGTLMYPANYNPTKKYPLIVYIYEKTSRMAMEFYPPTGYNYQGFSLLDYTTSGYFVLLPNISYEIGEPSLSALKCVNIATDKALENESIDGKRMGLIGHSFGGYETAFIATQTDRFATYVAGAAVTNVISHYHGVNWNNSATDLWRYEDQQWRMGDSYYDNKQAYLNNSPLEYVANVKRPILLWTGDKDYQVAWTQSLEMFIALRRLKKEASLILVKNEGHYIWNTEKQLLLSTEVKKWLDGYLKKGSGRS